MAWRAAACALALAASSASAQLDADAQRTFDDFQRLPPHRAMAIAPDGKANLWAGAPGADPSGAVERALKNCEERNAAPCSLYAVNDVVLAGRDWKEAFAPALPPIGRLRPQPYWDNKGPQAAAGLIIWSHGYIAGRDSTESAPQAQVAYFTRQGYDLYRFDRKRIRDRKGDALQLADAVRQARAMGYARVVLAGQSAGAWVSLAAAAGGAPVDGVISLAAAHHGTVKKMRDVAVARSDWRHLVGGIKPGPRLALVNFADDEYDVGGRMDDARTAFAASGVDALVIDDPPGFKGHAAARNFAFARKYGACLHAFIETGARQLPCD